MGGSVWEKKPTEAERDILSERTGTGKKETQKNECRQTE